MAMPRLIHPQIPILLEVYQLQRNSSLNPALWIDVGASATGSVPSNEGIAALVTLSDPGALNSFRSEFYRLSINLSPSQQAPINTAAKATSKEGTASANRQNAAAKKRP
jgi:hypothetical protein